MKVAAILAISLVVTALMFAGTPAYASDADEILLVDDASLTTDDMDHSRGAAAENNVVSNQTLSATATGNTVNVTGNLTTGNINIGDNFGGSGFGSYVNNTGNNTAINSAMSVTVNMAPAAP